MTIPSYIWQSQQLALALCQSATERTQYTCPRCKALRSDIRSAILTIARVKDKDSLMLASRAVQAVLDHWEVCPLGEATETESSEDSPMPDCSPKTAP